MTKPDHVTLPDVGASLLEFTLEAVVEPANGEFPEQLVLQNAEDGFGRYHNAWPDSIYVPCNTTSDDRGRPVPVFRIFQRDGRPVRSVRYKPLGPQATEQVVVEQQRYRRID